MKPLLGRCILAVDSDAAGLYRWRERLLAQGGRVICSASIDSALANGITFPDGTFDAAVIEHRPQSLNSAEVVEVMRALPAMRNLPLLIVAEAAEVEALMTRVMAPHVVLARPVAVDQVVDQLGRMFAAVHTPGTVSLSPPVQGSRGKVLMAEDDPVNAETLRAMLCQLGFSVVIALNGEEAVARAATASFDLMLMDGQMPVMDGLDATRIIRDDEARRGVHRPIIGVTASSLDEYRDQCIDAGMDDVVQKPVSMAGLLRMLARWLPEAPVPPVESILPAMASPPFEAAARPGVAASDNNVIDWTQIESLRSIDPQGASGVLGRAIGLYIDSAPKLIEEIRGFRSGKDIKDVRRAAHSLKSSSASLGATVVAGLSKAIESAAAQGDFEIIDSTVSSLEAEYWRAASELRKAVA
jgi:CheY-like chemotaxis protein/HPt (histidine-containing phosphotransfer) domain-containing protein